MATGLLAVTFGPVRASGRGVNWRHGDSRVGPALAIRPIVPDDRAGLARFYAGLSPESLEARFHGAAPTGLRRSRSLLLRARPRRTRGVRRRGRRCRRTADDRRAPLHRAAWSGPRRRRRGRGRGRRRVAAAGCRAGAACRRDRLGGPPRGRAPVRVAAVGQRRDANLIRSTGHPVSFGASGAGTLEATLDVRGVSAAPRAA